MQKNPQLNDFSLRIVLKAQWESAVGRPRWKFTRPAKVKNQAGETPSTWLDFRWPPNLNSTWGVFLLTTQNAFDPIERIYSVNTYSRVSTVSWGSEQSEWASPWTEWASPWTEWASRWTEWASKVSVAKISERPSGSFITRFSVTRNVPLETAQQRHDYAHVIAQTKEDNLKAKFRHRLERLYASHYLCMTNLFFGVCSRVD